MPKVGPRVFYYVVALLVFAGAGFASGCGSDSDSGPTESSGGSGGATDESGGANGSGGRSASGGSNATGGAPSANATAKCEEFAAFANSLAQAHGCTVKNDQTGCKALYAAGRCVAVYEALFSCLKAQPASIWHCNDDGSVAGQDSICVDEQQALQDLASGPGAGCLEPQ